MGGVGAVGEAGAHGGGRSEGAGLQRAWAKGVGAGRKLGDGRHLGALCIRGIRGGGEGRGQGGCGGHEDVGVERH